MRTSGPPYHCPCDGCPLFRRKTRTYHPRRHQAFAGSRTANKDDVRSTTALKHQSLFAGTRHLVGKLSNDHLGSVILSGDPQPSAGLEAAVISPHRVHYLPDTGPNFVRPQTEIHESGSVTGQQIAFLRAERYPSLSMTIGVLETTTDLWRKTVRDLRMLRAGLESQGAENGQQGQPAAADALITRYRG